MMNINQEWFLFPVVCPISSIFAASLFLKTGVIGAVPTAVARSTQLTQAQRSEASVFVVWGSDVSNLDVLDPGFGRYGCAQAKVRVVRVIGGSCHRWILTPPESDLPPRLANRLLDSLCMPLGWFPAPRLAVSEGVKEIVATLGQGPRRRLQAPPIGDDHGREEAEGEDGLEGRRLSEPAAKPEDGQKGPHGASPSSHDSRWSSPAPRPTRSRKSSSREPPPPTRVRSSSRVPRATTLP